MGGVEIKKGVYWVGVRNPELRVFDIIMNTDRGTTYNSYLIVDEKIVLIDTVKDGFYEEFIANIKSIIGERTIDYVVVQHAEPDHSGSLARILKEYKDAIVVGSKAALKNSVQIANSRFNELEAREDLNIGTRNLRFISAPFLHWPDTIYTYDEKDRILFTCDSFGCHYCDDEIFNDIAGDFSKEFKYYYDVIMGPFKRYVLQAIDRIRNLDIDVIATSHGPILRDHPLKYVEKYEEWSRIVEKVPEDKYALVMYVSAYGYTKEVAEAIAEGAVSAGAMVDIFDITSLPLTEIIDRIERAKAIAVGSPTINQDAVEPVWHVLSHISPITNRGKIAVSFGSYGWSGEAVPMINDRLKSLKFKMIEPGFKVNFKPTEEDIEKARSLGIEIGGLI